MKKVVLRLNRKFRSKFLKSRLLLGLISSTVLVPFSVYSQSSDCQNPEALNSTGIYKFHPGQEDLFIEFQTQSSEIVFEVTKDFEMAESLTLYKDSCQSKVISSQTLNVDSNNVKSLWLGLYDLVPFEKYLLKVERCDTNCSTTLGDTASIKINALTDLSSMERIAYMPCNLLKNGSYENLTSAGNYPNGDRQLYKSAHWIVPSGVTSSKHAADYFHSSGSAYFNVPSNQMGTQAPKANPAGNDAYAGLFTVWTSNGDFREWMTGTLEQNLIQDHTYLVKMYVSLADSSLYNFPCVPPGIKFFDNLSQINNLTESSIISASADIESSSIVSNTTDWIEVSGTYTATGNEKYLTISNFQDNTTSVGGTHYSVSFFYVDNVSVVDLNADNCCTPLVIEDGWDVDDLLNSSTFAPYISGNTLNVPFAVRVEGNFNVNEDLTIENTHLLMKANAEIEVNSISIPTNFTINGSVLEVCGDTMWKGISIMDNNSHLVVSESEIRDAEKGINSRYGGDFTVSGTLFDGNYYGIYVDAYGSAHTGTVKSSTFQSTDYLLYPYNQTSSIYYGLAAAGIYVKNVGNNNFDGITIGSSTAVTDMNSFYGSDFSPIFPSPGLIKGVETYYSTVKIVNNNFEGFGENSTWINQQSICIKVTGPQYVNTPQTQFQLLEVGGSNSFEKNYFSNSISGIVVDKSYNVRISNNNFDMNLEGAIAIWSDNNNTWPHPGYPGIEIIANTINSERGIAILNTNELYVDILDNIIDSYEGEGIHLENIPWEANIEYNVISNSFIGIYMNNLELPIVKNNHMQNLKTSPFTNAGYGIRLLNSLNHLSEIVQNRIETNLPSTNTQLYGLSVEMSDSKVMCNAIRNVGTGIHYGGVVNPIYTDLTYNIMESNHNGLVLSNNTVLSDIGSASVASENQWQGSFSGFHTYTDNSDGNHTTLWTQSGMPYQPTNNNGTPNPIVVNPTAPGSGIECAGFSSLAMGGYDEGLPSLEGYKLSDTALWLAHYQLYRSLPEDSLISNPEVQNYKDSMQMTTVGQLLEVKNEIHSSSFSIQQAETTINALSISTHLEENMKNVSEVLLKIKSNQWDSLPNSIELSLEALAKECPFEEGPAVYDARSILYAFKAKTYSNECELYNAPASFQPREKSKATEQDRMAIEVYPNPSRDQVNVSVLLNKEESGSLLIFDISGKEIMNSKLTNGISQINTEMLKPNIYYYQIIINNEVQKTDKLIIL